MKFPASNLFQSRIFAFFGADLDGYHKDHLGSLFKDGYILLALDSKAIERAYQVNVTFSIINDWFDARELLDITNIAWDCEINWFRDAKDGFTWNGICWPELDHLAMHWFWYDVILSLKLSDLFRANNILELLIISPEDKIQYYFDRQGPVCKEIWKSELGDRIRIIESKEELSHDKRTNDFSTILKFNQYLYSPNEIIKGKIGIFVASQVELSRSTDLMQDLICTFPKNVVLIPNVPNIPEENICKILNRWLIPIISPANMYQDDVRNLSEKFENAYENLIRKSSGAIWERSFSILHSHFLFYCQNRWPNLNRQFNFYLELFSNTPPQILIGSLLNHAEWHLPIIAAQRFFIPTLALPHSISYNPSRKVLQTDILHRFDYLLSNILLYQKIIGKNNVIADNKFISCINCTDINSYLVRKTYSQFPEKRLKILVLFSLTSENKHQNKLLLHVKNPKIQIESIKELNQLDKEFSQSISLKYKVHPGYPELELFIASGAETLQKILPIDSELQSILTESDLVIGVNYYGSALIHALQNNKPFINFITDEFFELSMNDNSHVFELLDPFVKTVHSKEELRNLIHKILLKPYILKTMKSDISFFSKKYLKNTTYPTIGSIIVDLLSKKRDNEV